MYNKIISCVSRIVTLIKSDLLFSEYLYMLWIARYYLILSEVLNKNRNTISKNWLRQSESLVNTPTTNMFQHRSNFFVWFQLRHCTSTSIISLRRLLSSQDCIAKSPILFRHGTCKCLISRTFRTEILLKLDQRKLYITCPDKVPSGDRDPDLTRFYLAYSAIPRNLRKLT